MGTYRTYADDFKEQVIKEYLSGERLIVICRKYEINKTQVLRWKKKYLASGGFTDGRGRSSNNYIVSLLTFLSWNE